MWGYAKDCFALSLFALYFYISYSAIKWMATELEKYRSMEQRIQQLEEKK